MSISSTLGDFFKKDPRHYWLNSIYCLVALDKYVEESLGDRSTGERQYHLPDFWTDRSIPGSIIASQYPLKTINRMTNLFEAIVLTREYLVYTPWFKFKFRWSYIILYVVCSTKKEANIFPHVLIN